MLQKSTLNFIFGDRTYLSLGSITTLLPTPPGNSKICVDVVRACAPFLIGLEILERKL
jgi:hypothetical protein